MKKAIFVLSVASVCMCLAVDLPKTGGTGSFSMGTLFGFYDSWASENWISCSVVSMPGSLGDYPRGTAKYSVGDNRSVYPRSATFYYWTTDYGPRENAKTVTINQAAYDVSVSSGKENYGVGGGIGIFHVTTEDGVYWKAYVLSWDVGDEEDWIEIVTIAPAMNYCESAA